MRSCALQLACSASQQCRALQHGCTAVASLSANMEPITADATDTVRKMPDARLLGADLLTATLTRLIAFFTTALQAYHVRAAKSGQTLEHMVLLEAAVQGWQVPVLLFCPVPCQQSLHKLACNCGKEAQAVQTSSNLEQGQSS